MTPPRGLAELQARYGKLEIEPDPVEGGYRIVSPARWETRHMARLLNPLLPRGKLFVHRDMAEPLSHALDMAARECPEYAIRTIGCWCVRYKRTVHGEISVHSWGLAVDINASTNKMAAKLITDMPMAFVQCFIDEGFTWGGHFHGTRDPMHFQWVSGY